MVRRPGRTRKPSGKLSANRADHKSSVLSVGAAAKSGAKGQSLVEQLALWLETGRPFAAHSAFEQLGRGAWRRPGFALSTLRCIESCPSPGGAQCMLLWAGQAQSHGAFPQCLGNSGAASGHALSALFEAPFWRFETPKVKSVRMGQLLADFILASRNVEETALAVRRALASWFRSEPHVARRAFEHAASSASESRAWICPLRDGMPLYCHILRECGFESSHEALFLAMGPQLWRRDPSGHCAADVAAETCDLIGLVWSAGNQSLWTLLDDHGYSPMRKLAFSLASKPDDFVRDICSMIAAAGAPLRRPEPDGRSFWAVLDSPGLARAEEAQIYDAMPDPFKQGSSCRL